MITKPFYYIIGCCILFSLASCKEFIEPSIAKRIVQLQAPGDKYQSANYTVNFWWDEVEDATQYRLQVVTPQFDTIGALIADTVVKQNKFAFNFVPGEYQWRVRAENGSTQTDYSAAKRFTVVASSIKQQTIQLGSPSDNLLTNQSSVSFKWSSLYGATKYHIQIDTSNFSNPANLTYELTVPGLQFTYFFPRDQQYQWRVRAENDTAQSQWSAIRLVNYDHTPPGQVSLTLPLNDVTVASPVTLQWNAVPGTSRYKLYVFKSDFTTAYNPTFPVTVTTNSYNFNLGTPGERVYWQVRAIDAAGNEGQSSVLRSFVVQ